MWTPNSAVATTFVVEREEACDGNGWDLLLNDFSFLNFEKASNTRREGYRDNQKVNLVINSLVFTRYMSKQTP